MHRDVRHISMRKIYAKGIDGKVVHGACGRPLMIPVVHPTVRHAYCSDFLGRIERPIFE